jgi:hypothetical protein
MRSYREILHFLIIREQLSLGWKIGFFIVCGALLYGSLTLSRARIQSVDFIGTVINDPVNIKNSASANYLTVRLDNGETVRARAAGTIEYRPGQRAIVTETSANFFGMRKHEFKRYLNESSRE